MISDLTLASLGFVVLQHTSTNSTIYAVIYLILPFVLFVIPMWILKKLNDHPEIGKPKLPEIPYSSPHAIRDKNLNVSYINWEEL